MRKFLNRYKYFLCVLAGAVCTIVSIFMLCEVAPFGRYSLLTVDFYHQYGPMLGELYDRVKNGSNLIYSFNMGMGLPFFRNFFNYMSSLFTVIILFVSRKNLLSSYSIIIGLKAVVSSLTMYFYLSKRVNKKNLVIGSLSILYAFNNYFTAYYWNIMWIDGLVFLPLITYGIERIIDDDKPIFYIISLGLMLISNYFIGFMLCIFSVIYFIIYLFFISKKGRFKFYIHKMLVFGVSSLCAGGIAAVCLIPMFTSLSSISATSDSWPSSQYYGFSLIEFIYNHLSGVNVTVFKSDVINAPNIACSIVVVPLLVLFILNNKIELRKRVGYLLLLGILILSFFWAPLDFIWHAFHVPNDLPYRYSFIYPFILIVIGAISIKNIDSIKDFVILIVFILSMCFVGSSFFVDSFIIDDKIVILNFIVLIVWYLMYVIYKYFHKKRHFINFISIILVVLECIIGVSNNWDISQNMESFYSDYGVTEDNLKFIRDNDDSLFYRVERVNMHTFNDPSWYNYYGITAFSSMEYENFAKLLYNLGMPGNEINSFYYRDNTPIYNIMFNLKYSIGNVSDSNYSIFYSDAVNENYVYKSNVSSSLMYRVNNDIKDWEFFYDNVFFNQIDFVDRAFGISDVIRPVIINKDNVENNLGSIVHKYSFDRINGYVYFSNNIDSMLVDGVLYVRDSDSYNISGGDYEYYSIEYVSENRVIYLDNIKEIYVSYDYESDNSLYLYYIDSSNLDKVSDYIDNNMVEITDFNEYIINGVYSGDGGVIYSSIPYDDNWAVFVDGERVNTYLIGNALLGFDIDSGSHNITLKYGIPYFKSSVCISLFSLIGVILYAFWDKKRN